MKAFLRNLSACAAIALACLALAGCGSKVKGNTYVSDPISISFASGGKATFASGPIGTDCTYTESGSKVSLTCTAQTMELTVDSDGNLVGPPEIGKLIKKK
ncbi:MAG TPA: hypothetical protein VK716_16875 [Terracidiphilus sp.]|nr:hypothetical protein [Terracidiphilus sp.]